jgi:hypothetical protein
MKKILFYASLLALYGCGKNGGNSGENTNRTEASVSDNLQETDESTMSTSTVTITRKVNLLDDFSNIEEFKESINTYLVTFRGTSG